MKLRTKAIIALIPVVGVALVVIFLSWSIFVVCGCEPPNEALISVQQVSCNSSTRVCSTTLTNSGTANGSITGCSLTYLGQSYDGKIGGANVVPAGGSAAIVSCDVSGSLSTTPQTGSNLTGMFVVSNGSPPRFGGVWS